VTLIYADAALPLPLPLSPRSTSLLGVWGDVTTWPSEGIALLILLAIVLAAAVILANWGNRVALTRMEALDAPSLPMPTLADNSGADESVPVPIPAGDPTAGEREPRDI